MNRKIINEINVTPFIDVMLVLLVIFMITSPVMMPEIQVDLPKTNVALVGSEEKTIVITVSKAGEVHLRDQLINLNNLSQRMLDISSDKNIRVFVRADKESNYGKVVKVMSVMQNSGFTKVALVTDNDVT
ncbi:MAG: biopolymer transporter ExbD [Rickettsiaceae bacterium H1]|nr:biopolymer transporter ExbD [Rickettsiaceae bacterium H1]